MISMSASPLAMWSAVTILALLVHLRAVDEKSWTSFSLLTNTRNGAAFPYSSGSVFTLAWWSISRRAMGWPIADATCSGVTQGVMFRLAPLAMSK